LSSTAGVVLADPRYDAVPDWDEFVDRHELGADWRTGTLRAAAWTTQHQTLLALVRDSHGRPAALFHCRLLGPVRPDRFARDRRPPGAGLVEVRRPPGAHPGIAVAPGLDRWARLDIVARFTAALVDHLGHRRFGVAYRHLGADDLRWLAGRGSVVLRVQPEAVLDNHWDSVDGYLSSLHHKRRNSIRRLRRRLSADAGLLIGTHDTVEPVAAARLVELVRSRHRRAWQLEPPIGVQHLVAVASAPDTRFVTYRAADSGRLLAFSAWRDTPAAIVNGLWGAEDPATGGRRDLYFDAAFRSVEAMIERGRPRLHMGKGMTDIKLSFGARLVPNYTVLAPLC
jgi:hypothetical protein